MDPKPSPEDTPENLSPLPENQENEYKEHAWVDHKSIESAHCDVEDTKESKTWEIFKTKVLEFARESRMSPEHILLIERSLPDLFPDLHVPDHPPYAAMIHKAITELDEAGGSTEEAISLFIRKEQNDLPWAHATLLKHHLEKLCQSGDVVVTGEKCYMLNTTCETYNPNQIKAFDTNRIGAFNPIQISVFPVPSFSPYSSPSSSSSGSYSDYTPYAKTRKQKMAGLKYGKKRHGDRKKSDSEEEYENNEEEHSEETEEEEEEEESEEYEDESEEFYNTEEEVEVTEIENRLIKYEGKHTQRTEGAKKNKNGDKSEFRDEPVKHQGTYNRGTKLARPRGRPLKCPKPKTHIGPKEAQVGLIEAQNEVAEIPRGLKQKRGRGRPSKNNGFETKTRPEKTQEQLWEIHNQPRGILNRPKESSPTKKIGTDTDIGPKEVHKEVMNAFNQATEDLNRPREKRGRGRPPKNMGNDTNIVQKETQGEVFDTHNQMEKPKQKRGRGRPPKNSGGQMVVFEVQNQTAEDGMKLKQGKRRFRRKHEREEVNKYLDQLELTVIEEMFEKMKISCDDGEYVYGAVSCEPVMEDNIRKEREQKFQRSVGGAEIFDKHDWTKLPKRSQELEDIEKLSWTPVQLPQEGTKDEAYPCQLHLQAFRSETDEYTTMNEMAPAQVVHEEQGEKQLLEIGEETSTFTELLHSEYQYIFNDKQLDQPKQSCGMSRKPTGCTGEDKDDRNSECNK